jgi:glyoxylase-like metal-dependent hydrolase (beta-lactamase superfamily II)
MRHTWIAAGLIVAMPALMLPVAAGAQDARTVIANASKAMGADGLNSIALNGTGANYGLGQSNNANGEWPRTNLNDYVRAIDFASSTSRATAVTWAAPVTGPVAVQGQFQQNITAAQANAWAQQLEIWTTPWGFMKGAAANNATEKAQTVVGQRYQVVTWMTTQKSPGGPAYRVVGYISPRGLVDRVETWLGDPVLGDMLVEQIYTEYRDANGVMFPAKWVQKRGGQPSFDLQTLGIGANPENIQALVTPPPPPAGRGGGPGGPGGPGGAPAGPTSEKLADGVFRINGAYNALAVEFADHILIFEPGPQNEARSQAIIAEAKKVIPNKPVRYGVISHHHFDHTGGLANVVAEGITIVTPAVNKAFLERAFSAPRTLVGDALAKNPKKPIIEGFAGDKRGFTDATRTFEVHVIKGLPHADGLVVGYLPKEKILVYADMFNLPPANGPQVPNPPVVGTMVFADNIARLGLTPERVMSVHSLNPDRLTTVAEINATLGRK